MSSSKVLWAIGDGAIGSIEAHKLADMVAADDTDGFVYLGDIYESGTFEECVRNYGSVYGILRKLTLAILPGNHDWPNHLTGYDPYVTALLGEKRAAHYSAFRLGSWQLLFMNSEEPVDDYSEQMKWLRYQLSKDWYGQRRIVFFHRPRYCSGSHGDAPDLEPIWHALEGKAKIVVSGHAHNMQRFKPQRGIVQFISGAGGRTHYATVLSDPMLDYSNPDRWGGLRIKLEGNKAECKFVGMDGTVLDTSIITA